MVGAPGIDSQAQRHALQGARLIPGHFPAFDVRSELLRPAADDGHSAPGALGEQDAQPVAAADLVQLPRNATPSPKRSHGASISPRSAHSIAMVPPAEMVSRPSSSQRADAASTSHTAR